MEESLISYSNRKQHDHTAEEEEEEESGWTTYFDDFFASQTRLYNDDDHHLLHQQEGTNSCSSCSVSDAASGVEYLKSSINMSSNSTLFGIGSSPRFSTKLKFKKTRTKGVLSYDDSLEDTASSPVNSPKVGSLKEMEFNQRKAYDSAESSTVQMGVSDDQFQVQKDGSRNLNMGFEAENNNNGDITYLRKKGMCLVPVSMLPNYLG